MSKSIKKVLIVDDEISIRQSFADFFEDDLWQVLQAESGEQALEVLSKESPDGAVVDIRMGGMDGDAMIREACERKVRTAFVICTGSPEYDVPHDLLELPCVSNHLFRKPVSDITDIEEELLRLIEFLNERKD